MSVASLKFTVVEFKGKTMEDQNLPEADWGGVIKQVGIFACLADNLFVSGI
jgi:hypothetical protein